MPQRPTTTTDMCAHQETRDRLHDLYTGMGVLIGGGASWLFGEAAFTTVLGLFLVVVSCARAELAARRVEGR